MGYTSQLLKLLKVLGSDPHFSKEDSNSQKRKLKTAQDYRNVIMFFPRSCDSDTTYFQSQ